MLLEQLGSQEHGCATDTEPWHTSREFEAMKLASHRQFV